MKKYWNDIHRQLFQRMHDLDYLQWMQKNSARYIAGAILLTLLVMTAVELEPVPMKSTNQEEYRSAFQDAAVQADTAMEQVEVRAAQDDILEGTDNADNTDRIIEEKKEIKSTAPERNFINPTALAGYAAPTTGMMQYGYGVGYDTVYDDYRFHSDVCYTAGDGNVMACFDGTVIYVQLRDQWQISIQCAEGIVQYAGLRQCNVQTGDVAAAGAQIGTAEDALYIRMLANE